MSIFIGGIIPAILIGVALIFLKLSGQLGIGAGSAMIFTAIGVAISGVIASLFGLFGGVSLGSAGVSILVGVFWGGGTLLMNYAVSKLGLPMPVSASIAATNVLVVLVLALIFFKDGASLDLIKLSLGVILIVAGSSLVTLA
jgi:hypothetical protein